MKAIVLFFIFLPSLLTAEVKPLKLDSIHPEWRRQHSPRNRVAITNPPVLFVPTSRVKWQMAFQKHDFQVSREANFASVYDSAADLKESFYIPGKLPLGKWYWRVRIDKGEWSRAFNFEIDQSSWENNAPVAAEFIKGIAEDHPRVLVRKIRLNDFRQEIQVSPYLKSIIKNASQYLDVELPSKEWGGKFYKNGQRVFKNAKFPDDHPKSQPNGKTFKAGIKAQAQAFIATGDKRYRDELLRWTVAAAKLLVERKQKLGHIYNLQDSFSYAAILEGLVAGFDTCYDYFSDEERKIVLHSLYKRATSYFKYFCNRLESRVIDNHSWQHTYLSFLEASIALKGHIPEADDWLTYAYNIWQARQPVQSTFDGGWNNGRYYGVNIGTWVTAPLHFKKYTAYNYYSHPWFKNHIKWSLYRSPPGSHGDGFAGNGYETNEKGIQGKVAAWLNILDAELDVPLARYLTSKAKPLEAEKQLAIVWPRFAEGLPLESSKPVPASIEVSQNRLFPDIGVANMNRDVLNSDKNLMVSMRSSAYGGFGHNHSSHNAFTVVYKGESLFVPYRYRHGGDGHVLRSYRHTRGHNSVTVDGKGQPYSADAYGYICRYIAGEQLSYIAGDASNAYTGEPSPQWWIRAEKAGVDWYADMEHKSAEKFRRHLLYLRPGLIVIYDELEAADEVRWDWILHCRKTLQVSGESLSVKELKASVNFFASEKLNYEIRTEALVPPFNVDRRGGKVPTVYKSRGTHAYISPQKKSKKLRLLSLMQVGEINTVSLNENGSYSCGEWIIEAELDVSKKAILKVRDTEGKVTFINLNDQGMSVLVEDGSPTETGEIIPLAVGKYQSKEAL
ncbi:MAG: DUF4962 domain-containing protein [Lentisphaerales bacterium]|nr:DUF4962 domain-containing protein [Lentisphaerales bacterium]